MKKFNFLLLSFLMLASVSFTSCSDDDEDEGGVDGSASELVGTWKVVSNTFIYKEDGEVVYERDETEEGLTCTFYADGRMTQYGETAKWSYKNGILTIKWEDEGEVYDDVWTVKELTSSKMVAESYDKYTEDGVTYEECYHIEWRKVSE